MEDSSPVKTPDDKNDADKTCRYRDLSGEDEHPGEETACYVDRLYWNAGASPGRICTSPLTRKDDPTLARARWADLDSGDDGLGVSEELRASSESRRRAELCAEG